MTTRSTLCLCIAYIAGVSYAHAADDLLITDFESENYGAWRVTGEAFGLGPARGTLPNQMPVSGYVGERLVNSFFRGDGTTGTLTSPEFKIERPFINFLIGGGMHPGETCINLLIDGKTARTATGPNDKSGGSEQLACESWDVADWQGQTAVLQIVDQHTGGWGHVNVDQITQGDQRRGALPATRELLADKRYLHLPVKTGASQRRMKLSVDGNVVREFDLELAEGPADFIAFVDVGAWQGKLLTIEAGKLVNGADALAAIETSASLPTEQQLYHETNRPQFHFTSRRGWLNDPNGLVYHQGEWHLFYQHNPYGWNWGNMHWGHAVSRDLVHWQELGDAIFPWSDCRGAAFSGSGLVDVQNTAGFKTGSEDVLVAALTDTDAGESIAYSNDRGRTWKMFEGNPVVKHQGRDPKIIWHAPTKRWVMAVYDEWEGKQYIAFHSSADLKQWNFESRIEGFFECPDLFEATVRDGPEASQRLWVLYAADGQYVLGDFDGHVFQPRMPGKQQVWYGNFYAAQTYFGAPDGRRVQIGWGRGIEFPGMPFNQQMTVPVDLTLRSTAEGVRMFAEPIPELAALHERTVELSDVALTGQPQAIELEGELLDIQAEFQVGEDAVAKLSVRGIDIVYDAAKKTIDCGVVAPLSPVDGKVSLRILADRGSVEVFGNHGRVAISRGVILDPKQTKVELAKSGTVKLTKLTAHQLKSAW